MHVASHEILCQQQQMTTQNLNRPVISQPTLAKAVDGSPATVATWRAKYGLLGDSNTGSKERKFFSVIDACVARMVVVLSGLGLAPADAIWFADSEARAFFEILLT